MNEPIRLAYEKASEAEANMPAFEALLTENEGGPPIITAYKGGKEALKAKYVFFPFSKLSHLSNAHEYFSEAVDKDPLNVEIRFLRFSVETYTPSMLGKSQHLQEDKTVILENIKMADLPISFKKGVAKFLIKSGRCSQEEVDFLEENFLQNKETP